MRYRVILALETLIPMFAKNLPHPAVPLGHRTAGARSEGQGRPWAGACALPLPAASTRAGWGRCGGRAVSRHALVLAVGVLSLGSGWMPAVAQSTPAVLPAAVDSHSAHIAEASRRFGIPGEWIRAVLRAESAGDASAISPAGAMGLMQVMPATWAELRARHGLGGDPYDPRDSILAGTAYLREMWDRYGNVAAMLAAYNAGPDRYDEYLSTGRTLPAETRAYVATIALMIDGEALPGGSIPVAAPPSDWREASLFVAPSGGSDSAAAPHGERPSKNTGVTPPEQETPHAPAPANELFVARAAPGDAP